MSSSIINIGCIGILKKSIKIKYGLFLPWTVLRYIGTESKWMPMFYLFHLMYVFAFWESLISDAYICNHCCVSSSTDREICVNKPVEILLCSWHHLCRKEARAVDVSFCTHSEWAVKYLAWDNYDKKLYFFQQQAPNRAVGCSVVVQFWKRMPRSSCTSKEFLSTRK